MKNKYYIGYKKNNTHTLIKSDHDPIKGEYPHIYACWGPFKTKKLALWVLDHAINSPVIQTVYDANRIYKQLHKF